MNDPGAPALRIGVLGPLRVWRGEILVDLGPVQQRVVLAVLALQAGRPVGRQQMINGVWGDTPPRHAVNLVQRHVSGLRQVLEPDRPGRAPSGLLNWTDAGYLLNLPSGALDLHEFESEVARARAARASGQPRDAAGALHSALELWRGPVCDGLSSPFLDAQADRLAETRISVLEERIELDLAIGAQASLIAELRDLVAAYPLRERLHGLLMLALYRAGRQADALTAFRDARRQLRDELGLEPAAPLQRLHQQILAADPELAAPDTEVAADAGATQGSQRPLPAQLPHRIPDFTGRDAELSRLDALVAKDTGTVVITAIAGTAGVGKTALAVHWAHRVSGLFPDGQLYVNLRGFDPTGAAMKPAEAIRGFLDAFGVVPQQIPANLEAQAALYRSLLAGRRVLILLDNAADEDQVRPLLPGSPGCLVIVTSRNELPGLIVTEGAHPVVVDLLSVPEARQLLSRRIGESRVTAEEQAVDSIIDLCARLPLALMLVAARAATHPGFRLCELAGELLAGELREAGGSLDAFDGVDQATNVRAVFSWSYQRLSDRGRRLFRLLGLHFGPDVAVAAVASLAGLPREQVRPALAELARAHLVTERIPGRFAFHDLLRAYAAEIAHTYDPDEYRLAAKQRVFDHYLHTACRADGLLNRYPDRPFTLADPPQGVMPESPADQRQALAWFKSERPVLLAALRNASGFDTHAWQLAWALSSFFKYQARWRDWRDSQSIALDASRRLSDKRAQALSHRLLGCALIQLSSYDDAHTHIQQALDLFMKEGDNAGQVDTHLNLSWVLERLGLYSEGLSHSEQALALCRAAGNRSGQARALNAVGWFQSHLGDHQQAVICCQQALDLQRQIGDHFGQADSYDSLGYAYRHLGRHRDATTCYEQALSLYRELGDRFNEADSLVSLGDAHEAFGDSESARIAWQHAVTIFEQLGDPHADRVRAKFSEHNEWLTEDPLPGRARPDAVPADAPVQSPG